MITTKKRTYVDELNEICKQNRGVLKAEDVVEYAKNPDTALHSKFTWDDDEASQLWRLHQARNIIRVSVVYEKRVDQDIRAFVSLQDDRDNVGGGYRLMTTVMSDKDMRLKLLDQAMAELVMFKEKYFKLTELADVFKEIDKTFNNHLRRG